MQWGGDVMSVQVERQRASSGRPEWWRYVIFWSVLLVAIVSLAGAIRSTQSTPARVICSLTLLSVLVVGVAFTYKASRRKDRSHNE
jgi:uncharacterized membrane protein YhaH (DUF805 family)